jgi:hypothetical protein
MLFGRMYSGAAAGLGAIRDLTFLWRGTNSVGARLSPGSVAFGGVAAG